MRGGEYRDSEREGGKEIGKEEKQQKKVNTLSRREADTLVISPCKDIKCIPITKYEWVINKTTTGMNYMKE